MQSTKAIKTKKVAFKVKEVEIDASAPVEAEKVTMADSEELDTSVSTEVTQKSEEGPRNFFMAWAQSQETEKIPEIKCVRKGIRFQKVKKTYESVPYGGLLQPYGPKPVKVKPEKEEKKEKKESSDKKDKKFYPKKDRKPINV